MLFVIFDSKFYHTIKEDPGNVNKIQNFNALGFTCLGLYWLLFCVAHWIFAIKYWIISYTMEIVESGGHKSKLLERNFDILQYGGLLLNVAIAVVDAVAQGKDILSLHFSYYMLVGVQILSCAFLFDACRRIIAVTNRNPDLKINVKAMSIHVTSYLLYLVSLIYFFFTSLSKSPRFLLSEIIKTVFSSLSQIFICYVFWSIHKIS